MFDEQPTPPYKRIDVEGVILDAELLVKYRFIERAVQSLEQAIQAFPKNLQLREKLCEICIDYNLAEKAAEQSVALSHIYAEAGDLDRANAVLVQAKSLNPQLSIAARLDQLKKTNPKPEQAASAARQTARVLSGDLASINLFDIIQIIENSRITGILTIESSIVSGRIFFNYGQIADAQAGDDRSNAAFRRFVDVCDGVFEMEKSPVEFKQNIEAPNNTNLILDVLREIDEERRDKMGLG
jgi:tetratricopeptide (TPR) repeat protein